MPRSRRLDEMEFELALVGALEDMYGVAVCVHGDPLNRRRKGYGTLGFDYFCCETEDPDAGGEVKVVVSVQGVPGGSFSFTADFSEPDSVLRAAEDCEDLALAIREQLGDADDGPPADDAGLDRRWNN
jgi:hypothetical protein